MYGSTHSQVQHYMEVSSQLHEVGALSRRTRTQHPLNGTLGGPESRPEHAVEEKNLLTRRESNHDSSVVQPAA